MSTRTRGDLRIRSLLAFGVLAAAALAFSAAVTTSPTWADGIVGDSEGTCLIPAEPDPAIGAPAAPQRQSGYLYDKKNRLVGRVCVWLKDAGLDAAGLWALQWAYKVALNQGEGPMRHVMVYGYVLTTRSDWALLFHAPNVAHRPQDYASAWLPVGRWIGRSPVPPTPARIKIYAEVIGGGGLFTLLEDFTGKASNILIVP